MIPFAVTIEGVHDGKPTWVLAVTEDKVLTAHKDGALAWYPFEKCRFAHCIPPDKPQPVMVVQPNPKNGLSLPNRVQRRQLERGG